ncbi:phosphatase PAP2 family protein [Zavarzinia sp. CC-PAN008]|uniref:phosphatase PAP2 family protein n=1 Tax=Zavarzinia sp. CC-PAN008 TaxID=3243332 RepID=UPI003F74324C
MYRSLLLAWIAATFAFVFVPQLDPAITRLFYEPGLGYPLSMQPWVDTVRRAHMILAWTATVGALVLLLILARRARGRPVVPAQWVPAPLRPLRHGLGRLLQSTGLLGLRPRVPLFLVLVMAIGPGLIVNLGLKEHSGRPRPSHTEGLGGAKPFIPVLVKTDNCARNCSFASGEVAMGFAWTAWALLAVRRRRAALVAAGLVGTAAALIRVAEGGHFASDAVFAGLISLSVVAVLYDLMLRGRPWRLTDPAAAPAPSGAIGA